jgi:hypothetical protein
MIGASEPQAPWHGGEGILVHEITTGRTPSVDVTARGMEMRTHHSRDRSWYRAATYLIRVQGSLRASWSDRLGGMQIKPDESDAGYTVLEGSLPDQAALIGVLKGLHDLGLPILLVECVKSNDESRADETA